MNDVYSNINVQEKILTIYFLLLPYIVTLLCKLKS